MELQLHSPLRLQCLRMGNFTFYIGHYSAQTLILEIHFKLRIRHVGRVASAVCCLLMRQELDVYTLHTEPSVSERTCHGSGGSSPAAEEAKGQAAPRVFRLSPVRIITPPVYHTHHHHSTSLITRTRGRSLGTFQQGNVFCFSDIGETEKYFRIAFSILRRYDADGYGRIRCEIYCRDQQLTF
jgi:hypothetical protein